MIASWATDPQRNANLQNEVNPLGNDNKMLCNAERHFEDIIHDINKAVDNTNAGSFGTNPTPLWESVCPTDANNYPHAQRIRLGITDTQNSRKYNQPTNASNNNNNNGNTYNRNKDKKLINNNNNHKDNERTKNKFGIFKRQNPKEPLGLQNIPKWT
jgi:hypothetical protein